MYYLDNKTVLITGGAGFVGYHFAKKLLRDTTCRLVLVDNLNDYYNVKLKKDRLKDLGIYHPNRRATTERITFYEENIANKQGMQAIFSTHDINAVVHMAAQAGVRYAKLKPEAYVESNIDGFFVIMQLAVLHQVDLCLYASSSSVYGNPKEVPFVEDSQQMVPLSFYAATKLSGELLAQTYSQTSGLRCVGMRFFNVYGPWGRPDMAYYAWATALRDKQPITLHGAGQLLRDMTYIDDVTESMHRLIERYAPTKGAIDPQGTFKNHQIFNIGNSQPVVIKDMLDFLVERLGPPQGLHQVAKGEEEADRTYASTDKLARAIDFAPQTDMRRGLSAFLEWFQAYV